MLRSTGQRSQMLFLGSGRSTLTVWRWQPQVFRSPQGSRFPSSTTSFLVLSGLEFLKFHLSDVAITRGLLRKTPYTVRRTWVGKYTSLFVPGSSLSRIFTVKTNENIWKIRFKVFNLLHLHCFMYISNVNSLNIAARQGRLWDVDVTAPLMVMMMNAR